MKRIIHAVSKIRINHVFHRLVYAGLATSYGVAYMGADKDLIGLVVAVLYLSLAVRG